MTPAVFVTVAGPGVPRPLLLELTPGEPGEGGYCVRDLLDPELHTQGDTVGECVDMALDAAAMLAAARAGAGGSP